MEKPRLMINGRKEIYNTSENWKKDTRPVAHFHAASLGEFEQARPVIEKFKSLFDYKILVTFFSPSGYEVRKNYPDADHVCYLPFDNTLATKKFVQYFRPKVSLFVKYEFWYNVTKQLKESGTILISFSSIFRPEQTFLNKPNAIRSRTIKLFDYFFVQNKISGRLLEKLAIKNVEVTGDTRFDRVYKLCQNPKKLPEIKKFINQKPCFVIGSSWKEDLDVILPILQKFKAPLKIIIAPHNIHENDIKEVEQLLQMSSIRYSEIKEYANEKVLIIDNMGMLSSVYNLADICHIGGGFRTGLHNTLEAATFGIPVITGPNYEKFQEVQELIDLGCCFSIRDSESFGKKFKALYNNEHHRAQIKERLQLHIRSQMGATDSIIRYCKNELL